MLFFCLVEKCITFYVLNCSYYQISQISKFNLFDNYLPHDVNALIFSKEQHFLRFKSFCFLIDIFIGEYKTKFNLKIIPLCIIGVTDIVIYDQNQCT